MTPPRDAASSGRALAAIGSTAGRLLGAVLVIAAWAKAVDPQAFAAEVASLLPAAGVLALPLAVAAIAFETGLGTALLLGWRQRAILLLASLTFAVFTAIAIGHVLGGDSTRNCGCFGQLLERTPAQALLENVAFLGISALAWTGRAPGRIPRWPWLPPLAATAAAAFAVAAPRLPLDDIATGLAPGIPVTRTRLDEIVPELATGRHLLVLLDRRSPEAPAQVATLNERLRLPGGTIRVWGIAADDPEVAAAFLWTAGPAFEIRSGPANLLRRLYRVLPRSALVENGRIVRTWTGLPSEQALDALGRGDLP